MNSGTLANWVTKGKVAPGAKLDPKHVDPSGRPVVLWVKEATSR